jgi:hypothetical protein
MLVFTRCVFTISQILRTIFKIDTEKQKKRNLARIVFTKRHKYKWPIHVQFVFFVSPCAFRIWFRKKLRDDKHTSNEHIHIFSKKIRHLEV